MKHMRSKACNPHSMSAWGRACLRGIALALMATVTLGQNRLQPMPDVAPTHTVWSGSSQLGWSSSMPGADVIYSNTSLTGYYARLFPGETLYDSAQLPSPSFPGNNSWGPGCAQQYTVTGIEFGYGTDLPAVDLEISFASQYDLCYPNAFTPVATKLFTGLPGSSSGGLEFFTVTVDLRSQGPAGPFTLLADGDGTWGPFTSEGDTFGISFRFPNSTGGITGLIAAGNSSGTIQSVRWSKYGVDYSLAGIGCYNYTFVEIEPGNYCDEWMLAAGPYMRFFADACGPLQGQPVCTGGGSAPCPCNNTSPFLNAEGCRNSVNSVNGGRLEVLGTASLSADTTLLRAVRLPSSTSVLFFQGTGQIQGGVGQPFGDGLRCAGGTIRRLGTVTAGNGQAEYPSGGALPVSLQGAITAPGTRTYQAWYRNSADFCTSAPFNLTNGWTLDWAL